MKNLLISVVITVLLFGIASAQKTDEISDKIREARIDSLFSDVFGPSGEGLLLPTTKKNYQFLYWRMNNDSKTFFAGREIGENQYNVSSQLYYLHSNGIFAGVSGSWYSQLDPGYRTTVLSAGYSKGLKRLPFLRFRLSYDYYLYNSGETDFDPLFTSGVDAGMTIKSKSLGTRFDAYLLLGKETGSQLSWDFYGNINLIKLGLYNKISFEPEVSLYFGSEAVEFQLNEVLIDPVTNEEYSSFYKDRFGLMNIQLELPVSVKFKSFDFEAAWVHNFPQTMDDGWEYLESSFLRISLGYFFSL